MGFGDLTFILYLIPVILVSLSFHELAHAYISYRLGDPTAKNLGRLSLNPLKHLDPLGTIMLILSSIQGRGFGWAKPVPINPTYYRDRRKGTMLVSLAGPLSNVLLAFVFSFPMAYIGIKYGADSSVLFSSYGFGYAGGGSIQAVVFNLCRTFYIINIGLAIFNIIPVPPLDGSKILGGILPPRQYFKMMEYENYIGLIFLVIMFMFPRILSLILSPFMFIVEKAIGTIVAPIVGMLV